MTRRLYECPGCGAELLSAARACPNCGEAIVAIPSRFMDEVVPLPNADKPRYQYAGEHAYPCITPDGKHTYKVTSSNGRGDNYSTCTTCGATMYVDSSD